MIRKALLIIAHIAAVVALIAAFGFIRSERSAMRCESFTIRVDHDGGAYFIDKQAVEAHLRRNGWGQLVGRPVDSVDLTRIERLIEKIPFVAEAEAFADIYGNVRLDVEQREPVLRIVNQNYQSFYIDQNGKRMPTTTNYAAQVPVASGFIAERLTKTDTIQTEVVRQLVALNAYIQERDDLKNLFVQYYVNADHELELIPRVGEHSVLIGDLSDLDEKFEKLLVLYKLGFDEQAWREYRLVNLKFKDQVICKK